MQHLLISVVCTIQNDRAKFGFTYGNCRLYVASDVKFYIGYGF